MILSPKAKSISEKTALIMTSILAFGINLPIIILPKILLLWICAILFFTICHLDPKKLFSKNNLPYLLFILFYLWSVITLFYTSDKNAGIRLLERRLTLIVIPFLCLFFKEKLKGREIIFTFFILGNIFSISWCLLSYNITGGWGPTEFRINYISKIISAFKHSTYFGLNLSVGFYLFAYLIRDKKIWIQFVFLSLYSFLLFMFIYTSQSRMSLFVLSLSVVIVFISLLIKLKKIIFIPSSLIILTLFVFLILKTNPSLQKNNISKTSIENIDKERMSLWENSLISIKDNLLIGIGIGDSKVHRLEINKPKINPHNQILSLLLEGGIISILLFFGAWFAIFFILKKDNKLKFYFSGILLTFFLFLLIESTFNRIANISLFIFILFTFLEMEDIKSINKSLKSIQKLILLIIPFLVLLSYYTFHITFKEFEI